MGSFSATDVADEARILIVTNATGRKFFDYKEDFFSCLGMESPLYQASFENATMIGSICEDGTHAPLLDIDFAAKLSVLPNGKQELIMNVWPKEEAVEILADVAREVGISGEVGVIDDCGGMLRMVLDCPAVLVPSETPDHFHLYLETKLSWQQYARFLTALYRAAVIERGFYDVCFRNEKSTLTLPWIRRKSVLPEGY